MRLKDLEEYNKNKKMILEFMELKSKKDYLKNLNGQHLNINIQKLVRFEKKYRSYISIFMSKQNLLRT